MSKQSGHIICELTTWAEGNKTGKGKKSDNKTRSVLMLADRRNWTIAMDRGYITQGHKFSCKLGDLLHGIPTDPDVPRLDTIKRVVEALTKITGVVYDLGGKTVAEIATDVDTVFKCDLMNDLHPKIAALFDGGSDDDVSSSD